MATVTGEWVRIKHLCELPSEDVPRGSIWRCECGRRWVLVFNVLDWLDGGSGWRRAWWPAAWSRKSAR